jgi:HIV Tat-specific factor 1
MVQCGMVEYDVRTKKARIKLYREADGLKPKGDALCSYIKPESVQLALTILDGSEFEGQV